MADRRTRESQVPKYISLKVCEELYEIIAREADREHVPMIDIVVRTLAHHFKHPELGYVPRQRLGRPRKELAAK